MNLIYGLHEYKMLLLSILCVILGYYLHANHYEHELTVTKCITLGLD